MMMILAEETVISRLISLEWVWLRTWISFAPKLKQVFPLCETDNEYTNTPKPQPLSTFSPQQMMEKVFKWFASILIRYLFVKLFYIVSLWEPKHLKSTFWSDVVPLISQSARWAIVAWSVRYRKWKQSDREFSGAQQEAETPSSASSPRCLINAGVISQEFNFSCDRDE